MTLSGRRYDTVTFLSDYGRADEFVGVVHSVLRSLAPHAAVIDLTHDVEPYDVRGAGLLLARSAQYLAAGVVLAIVDPGVGGSRRGVAIEVGDGESVLVGPDNGVLAPAVSMVGGAGRAVVLDNPEYQLPAPGPTFAGRDVFAPAAGHLCAGIDLSELGETIDPITIRPGVLPLPRPGDGGLVAEVLWIDRFGNAQLNVDPDELSDLFVEDATDRLHVVVGGAPRLARVAPTYEAIRTGEVGLVVDSYGLVSLAADRGSAAGELGLRTGDEVTLRPLGDDGAPADAGVTTPVELRRGPDR